MYKKIMVPLDGSELAECVLPHVVAIAQGCDIKDLILVRVVEPEKIYQGEYSIGPETAAARESERVKEAEDYLREFVKRLTEVASNIRVEVIVGRVAEGLVDYGVKNKVDLILIATHGRSGVTRWVRGSVADKILRSSRIPVMMVRAPGTEEGV